VYACRVREDGDFCSGTISVAKLKGVINYLGKFRIKGRLAVSGEGYRIYRRSVKEQAGEAAFEGGAHLGSRREAGVPAPVLVPAAFAIDAVERAYLAVLGEEVDS